MRNDTYIRSVLEHFEGKGLVRGYIPRDKSGAVLGQSGVTIGTGVDLGQQTREGLIAMGVPVSIVQKFLPYLGRKKDAAAQSLATRPLELSREEVAILDERVAFKYISDTEWRFDRNAAHKFADRPREVQAVAVSLEYQLGPMAAAVYVMPIALGNYLEADRLLRAARSYKTRRTQEADLLARAMR